MYKNHLFAVRGFLATRTRDPTFFWIFLLNQIKKCMCVYDWMLISSRSRTQRDAAAAVALYSHAIDDHS